MNYYTNLAAFSIVSGIKFNFKMIQDLKLHGDCKVQGKNKSKDSKYRSKNKLG